MKGTCDTCTRLQFRNPPLCECELLLRAHRQGDGSDAGSSTVLKDLVVNLIGLATFAGLFVYDQQQGEATMTRRCP